WLLLLLCDSARLCARCAARFAFLRSIAGYACCSLMTADNVMCDALLLLACDFKSSFACVAVRPGARFKSFGDSKFSVLASRITVLTPDRAMQETSASSVERAS